MQERIKEDPEDCINHFISNIVIEQSCTYNSFEGFDMPIAEYNIYMLFGYKFFLCILLHCELS